MARMKEVQVADALYNDHAFISIPIYSLTLATALCNGKIRDEEMLALRRIVASSIVWR